MSAYTSSMIWTAVGCWFAGLAATEAIAAINRREGDVNSFVTGIFVFAAVWCLHS